MTSGLGFWVVAVVLVGASLGVVLTPNLFHAVLWLALALVATAGAFLVLDAPFLFAVQLLLYAGGAITILVFAIMLTERLVGERLGQANRWPLSGALVAAAVLAAILGALGRPAAWPALRPSVSSATSQAVSSATSQAPDWLEAISRALAGPFALPLEVLGVLLLAALVAALHFARPED